MTSGRIRVTNRAPRGFRRSTPNSTRGIYRAAQTAPRGERTWYETVGLGGGVLRRHSEITLGITVSDTDFYVSVATAIPAILVVYAVGMTGYASRVLGPDYQRDTEATVAAVLGLISTKTGKFKAATAAIAGVFRWSGNILILLVYAAAVVVPVAAEVAALYALSSGPSSLTKTLCWVGVLVGLVAAGLPLLVAGLKALPFWSGIKEWNSMTRLLRAVRTMYTNWEQGKSTIDWAADSIRIWRVRGSNSQQSWNGKADLAHLVSNAWNGTYPEWIEPQILARDVLGVLDRVKDVDGANPTEGVSVFKFENHEVVEMWVYERRSDAEAAYPRFRPSAVGVTPAVSGAGALPPGQLE